MWIKYGRPCSKSNEFFSLNQMPCLAQGLGFSSDVKSNLMDLFFDRTRLSGDKVDAARKG